MRDFHDRGCLRCLSHIALVGASQIAKPRRTVGWRREGGLEGRVLPPKIGRPTSASPFRSATVLQPKMATGAKFHDELLKTVVCCVDQDVAAGEILVAVAARLAIEIVNVEGLIYV